MGAGEAYALERTSSSAPQKSNLKSKKVTLFKFETLRVNHREERKKERFVCLWWLISKPRILRNSRPGPDGRRRLALVRAIPRLEVDVFGVQRY